MVHLAAIANDNEIKGPDIAGLSLDRLKLDAHQDEDSFTTTVYGSKYAVLDLPRHEMPENEMPKEVAYRMIKDDLSLDGNPTLNLASFVTTYMVQK
jgi:glutamate decarboxylase